MTRFDDIQARRAAVMGSWMHASDGRVSEVWGPPSEPGKGDGLRKTIARTTRGNAEFIAHCPDDVGWLLDRVTQLETALERLGSSAGFEGAQDFVWLRARCPEAGSVIDELVARRAFARAALDTEQP